MKTTDEGEDFRGREKDPADVRELKGELPVRTSKTEVQVKETPFSGDFFKMNRLTEDLLKDDLIKGVLLKDSFPTSGPL